MPHLQFGIDGGDSAPRPRRIGGGTGRVGVAFFGFGPRTGETAHQQFFEDFPEEGTHRLNIN